MSSFLIGWIAGKLYQQQHELESNTMNDDYDYEIFTKKLNPPLGENRYAAKVSIMVKRLGSRQTQRVNPNIGEMWGKTEQEAYQKVRQAIEGWIAARS